MSVEKTQVVDKAAKKLVDLGPTINIGDIKKLLSVVYDAGRLEVNIELSDALHEARDGGKDW